MLLINIVAEHFKPIRRFDLENINYVTYFKSSALYNSGNKRTEMVYGD